MKKFGLLLALLLVPLASGLAQPPRTLPQPLRLPPGLEETLPISRAGSYIADATRIQDCPEDQDNPLGLCNNVLFGGPVLFASPLTGSLRIRFFPPRDNIAEFEISHLSGLLGEDVVERAPILFEFLITGCRFADAPRLARGEVDLTTGEVKNLD